MDVLSKDGNPSDLCEVTLSQVRFEDREPDLFLAGLIFHAALDG